MMYRTNSDVGLMIVGQMTQRPYNNRTFLQHIIYKKKTKTCLFNFTRRDSL